jgi:hypothetical protein
MRIRLRRPADKGGGRAPALLLVCAFVAGCYEGTLYDPAEVPIEPNKVSFTGTACTDNPAERAFPLRVVFVVDVSPIQPLDPADTAGAAVLQTQRVQAVRDAVQVLRAPDAAFSLIRFGGDTFSAPTGRFTSNTQEIVEAAGALTIPMPCTNDGCRVSGKALSLASSLISGDLLSTPRGPRSRTKYVVVWMQAGPTDDRVLAGATSAQCDAACVLGNRTKELREFVLANGGADFQLHAVDVGSLHTDSDLSTPGDPYLTPTQEQLRRMAFSGAGEYKPICAHREDGSFVDAACGPQRVSLLTLDINSARNVFLSKSFVVSNMNALTTADGRVIPDSDADGISDELELQYGTDPSRRDTDGDGITDKTELLLSTVGLDPFVPDDPGTCAPIDPALRTTLDTDGDGLTDCEEALLRLDATLFDTDADGIPDPLELIAGTNFLLDDGLSDGDFDGTPNIDELKAHTNPRAADAKARSELGYLYREVDLGIRELLFSTQPRQLTGVTIEEVNLGSSLGNASISYVLAGNERILAWRDAAETQFGPAVTIPRDGVYRLSASCDGAEKCERGVTVSVTTLILPPFSVDELVRVSSAQRQCINFRVRNVTLVETLEADGQPRGHNDIRIFFGQVPAQVRGAFGIFRVAQFPFIYLDGPPPTKNPNIAELLVDDFNFVLFE